MLLGVCWTLEAAHFPLPHSLHTSAGEEEQPADWRNQAFKSFDTFPPRLGLERDVPANLRDQIRGMRELDRLCCKNEPEPGFETEESFNVFPGTTENTD